MKDNFLSVQGGNVTIQKGNFESAQGTNVTIRKKRILKVYKLLT